MLRPPSLPGICSTGGNNNFAPRDSDPVGVAYHEGTDCLHRQAGQAIIRPRSSYGVGVLCLPACVSAAPACYWSSFFLFPFLNAEGIQVSMGRMGAAKAQKRGSPPPEAGEAPKPQLLNADSNPTLRYPVSVWESSVSCGWLDVTRTGVSYAVVESGRKGKASSGERSSCARRSSVSGCPGRDPGEQAARSLKSVRAKSMTSG